MHKKIIVLDTNVFIYDPECLEKFEDNDIVIPAAVLMELDKKKKDNRNARQAIRNIEKYRLIGNLVEGVENSNGGLITIEFYENNINFPYEFNLEQKDNLIVGIALQKQKRNKDKKVILVSQDINMRIKSDSLNIKSEKYHHYTKKKREDINYIITIDNDSVIDTLYQIQDNTIPSDIINIDINSLSSDYFILKSSTVPKKSIILRYDRNTRKINKIKSKEEMTYFNIHPQNAEQLFLINSLFESKYDIVFGIGPAGTGKTLLSLLAGLNLVLNNKFDKLVVFRNNTFVGQSIGYLPGDANEKLSPHMGPIYDNLEFIFQNMNTDKMKDYEDITLEYLKSSGLLKLESSVFSRGRTFNNSFIIIDEGQNLTPHEIKTLITRLGDNSKLVILGDPDQIDVPMLSRDDNGLIYAADRFKENNVDFAVSIHLSKSVRSKLVKTATDIL